MPYTVTYRETDTTPLQHDTLMALPAEEVELEDIVEACCDYSCDADLYDAAGFRKGWVHADGTYSLT